ncbi:hypothetical protein UPYG_G00334880 [Umbra pygmaea]|uniref:Neural chondroitin sulphate proteoglycan cytoplasmic domain-containing protein n=1 Tax=Umbra pygmaea TaxID=75934 RepID=A0ABD0W052_UMBPY
MAREERRSSSCSLMLSLLLWLSAHGEHSLVTVSGKDVQQSKSSRSTVERAVLSGDELIGIGLALGAGLPVRASKFDPSHKRHSYLDIPEEYDQPISEEFTGEEIPEHSDDVIGVEFHNSDHPSTSEFLPDSNWRTAIPRPLQQRVGDPTAWTLSDFYDYLSPGETTLEPEPTLTPPTDMEDENPSLTNSPIPSVTLGNNNPQPPSQSQRPPLSSLPQGSGGCGLGFVRSEVGGECVSQCDAQPDFCYNRGVCTITTGIGAFCRCNLQDYVWNKGSRCDWVVTDFQVLCVIVGVASLTLVLLIVIIIFFAKRLHHLRMENRRLRKRRGTQSMMTYIQLPPAHNLAYYDNIICQDDPQKIEELVKSPPTEEESLNIANSHSPKHVNNCSAHSSDHTPNNDVEEGVTIGLQLLLPKEAKLRPAASPPLQYDIFLYKKGAGPSSATNNTSNYTNMAEGRNLSNPNALPTRMCSKTSRSYTSKSNPDLNHGPKLNHVHTKDAPASQNHVSPQRHRSSPSPDHSSSCINSPQRASVAPYQALPHNTSPPHHPLSLPPSPPLRTPRGRCRAPLVPLHPSPSSPLLRYIYSTNPCSPHLPRANYNPVSTYSLS